MISSYEAPRHAEKNPFKGLHPSTIIAIAALLIALGGANDTRFLHLTNNFNQSIGTRGIIDSGLAVGGALVAGISYCFPKENKEKVKKPNSA